MRALDAGTIDPVRESCWRLFLQRSSRAGGLVHHESLCGGASITLRRDGKVVLKGIYLETHATGVNHIKGGTVQIN